MISQGDVVRKLSWEIGIPAVPNDGRCDAVGQYASRQHFTSDQVSHFSDESGGLNSVLAAIHPRGLVSGRDKGQGLGVCDHFRWLPRVQAGEASAEVAIPCMQQSHGSYQRSRAATPCSSPTHHSGMLSISGSLREV